MAAIQATNLTNGTASNQQSLTTGSISPVANNLIILTIGTNTSSTPNVPSVSGNGLTWVQIATATLDDSGHQRLTMFRAMGASPTPGAVTMVWSPQNQTDIYWSINQFAGTVITGSNGANAVVQSNINTQTGVATNFSVTLGTFQSGANATHGSFYMNDNSPDLTPGANFSTLSYVSSSHKLLSEFAGNNQTNVNTTIVSANRNFLGVAIEIKALDRSGILIMLG